MICELLENQIIVPLFWHIDTHSILYIILIL